MKFIESICLKDGELRNLDLHQRRVDLTLLAHFGAEPRIDLAREITRDALPAQGLFKIRVRYERTISGMDIESYVRKPIEAIRLLDMPVLDYRFKYEDRRTFENCANGTIFLQNGLVTDATYANVCFFNGKSWLTPQNPLLRGVARQLAIKAHKVAEADISHTHFKKALFTQVKYINSMNLFDEAETILLPPNLSNG